MVLVALLILASIPALAQGHSSMTKILLVSLDGFRHDYFELAAKRGFSTPNMDKLRAKGVFAEVQNVFPTKTEACHYTIVTGLYPENHGVVHNIFYDPVYNETYNPFTNHMGYKWYNGTDPSRVVEPIWITNQKAKHALKPRWSGVYQWPASDVSFQHHLPLHHFIRTDATAFLPFDIGAQTIVNWFANEEAPINLGLLYMPQPDHAGHYHGTTSTETLRKVQEVDQGIGELISLLEEHDLFHHINIIITSDHGMADVGENNIVYLNDYLDKSTYTMYGDHVVAYILPHDETKTDEIYGKLQNVTGLEVYLKGLIPERYHYRHNRRILPILVVAKMGWLFADERRPDANFTVADHGYDNLKSEMHPFLLATGPAFKENYTSPELVNQVDLYELMCHILQIKANPNDGNLQRVKHLLNDEEKEENEGYTIFALLAVIVFVGFVSGVCCVAVCRINTRRTRKLRHLQAFPPERLDATSATLLAESDEEIP